MMGNQNVILVSGNNRCQDGGLANPVEGLTVTLQAGTEDLFAPDGFSLQLNAWTTALTPQTPNGCHGADLCCPAPTGVCWMQYIIYTQGNDVMPWIQYFDNNGADSGPENSFYSLPNPNTLPAGWALQIALNTDNGNVSGINLSVIDNNGVTQGQKSMPVPTDNSSNQLEPPILAFTVNVVMRPGDFLPNCASAPIFSSGNGCINYEVSTGQLCVQQQADCSNIGFVAEGTCENSNASYGAMSANCGPSLSQSFTA
jgi:hypothetical protein